MTPRTRPAARPAKAALGRFPARVLHLVDIENLVGTGMPVTWEVADVHRAYAAQVGVGPMDQVVIGCSHGALLPAGDGWPGVRYLVRSGPDGADTELLRVIAAENIPARFGRVVIASGDGAFALAAAALAAAGCDVTVASRPGSLSRRLALAARRVVRLELPEAGSAALRPDAA